MANFSALLDMARSHAEPQRMLFVFAKTEDAGGLGMTLAPVMYNDWPLDEISDFAAIVAETQAAGFDWDIVCVAGFAGNGGRLPTPEQADERLQIMVKAIHQGELGRFLIFDRQGEAVHLAPRTGPH